VPGLSRSCNLQLPVGAEVCWVASGWHEDLGPAPCPLAPTMCHCRLRATARDDGAMSAREAPEERARRKAGRGGAFAVFEALSFLRQLAQVPIDLEAGLHPTLPSEVQLLYASTWLATVGASVRHRYILVVASQSGATQRHGIFICGIHGRTAFGHAWLLRVHAGPPCESACRRQLPKNAAEGTCGRALSAPGTGRRPTPRWGESSEGASMPTGRAAPAGLRLGRPVGRPGAGVCCCGRRKRVAARSASTLGGRVAAERGQDDQEPSQSHRVALVLSQRSRAIGSPACFLAAARVS
jgi:hypothetical protein